MSVSHTYTGRVLSSALAALVSLTVRLSGGLGCGRVVAYGYGMGRSSRSRRLFAFASFDFRYAVVVRARVRKKLCAAARESVTIWKLAELRSG